MLRIIAIGDVHTAYSEMWDALRESGCLTRAGEPTEPFLQGRYQVVLMGDLLHPKSLAEYCALAEVPSFDFDSTEHLLAAARAQVRQLEKLRGLAQQLEGRMHILLGNHDDAVLRGSFTLGTSGGITHREFEPHAGGVHFPRHLREWFARFLRELRIGTLQFAHVGPMPAMGYYDDLFYSNRDHKRWWKEQPELITTAGLSFGVYGHTVMEHGIEVFGVGDSTVAMIDALSKRQFLELLIDPSRTHPVKGHTIREF